MPVRARCRVRRGGRWQAARACGVPPLRRLARRCQAGAAPMAVPARGQRSGRLADHPGTARGAGLADGGAGRRARRPDRTGRGHRTDAPSGDPRVVPMLRRHSRAPGPAAAAAQRGARHGRRRGCRAVDRCLRSRGPASGGRRHRAGRRRHRWPARGARRRPGRAGRGAAADCRGVRLDPTVAIGVSPDALPRCRHRAARRRLYGESDPDAGADPAPARAGRWPTRPPPAVAQGDCRHRRTARRVHGRDDRGRADRPGCGRRRPCRVLLAAVFAVPRAGAGVHGVCPSRRGRPYQGRRRAGGPAGRGCRSRRHPRRHRPHRGRAGRRPAVHRVRGGRAAGPGPAGPDEYCRRGRHQPGHVPGSGSRGAVTARLDAPAGPNGRQRTKRSVRGQAAGIRRPRERLYTAVNALPGLSKLEDPAFQDRLQLAEQGSRSGPGRLVTSLVGAGQAAVSLSGFIATLVALSPVTAAVVLASALPAFLVQLSLSRAQAAMLWRTGHGQRREVFYARLLSTPYAAKEVRLFGLGTFFRDRMLSELTAVNAEHRRLGRRQVRAHGALALLAATVAGAGLVWVISQAKAGALTVGGVAVFVAAVAGVQGALANGVQHAATAHHGLLLFEHYQTVLTIDPDVPVPARPHAVPVLRHGIALHDVWFRYSADHPWVLRGVDLFIPHGRTVALVGLNGAGKSTLVKLLCRFYDPTRGAIEWDGIDVREVDPARLRERIGAVFQDFSAYDLTAAENIGVGDLAALDDRSRIEAAARRAGAHDMVTGLPRGYDTLLTRVFFQGSDADDPQTGVLLSGGQWQRVALARALLRDGRDLMILDEPSAGLDAQAEYEVHAALRAHRAGRTALLISHRLSAVRDADLIVVLADGRVVEQGSHAELMAMQGRYAELFEVQARGYADLASTDLANADLASTAGGR